MAHPLTKRPTALAATMLLILLAPSSVAVGADAPLAEAVTFAPLGTSSLLFTDWAVLKRAYGHDGVTSASPLEQRIDAMLEMTRAEATSAAFAIRHLEHHADTWGWDSTDLDWEASASGGGPPVAILRFREGFDLEPVLRYYDERDFSSDVYGDATIRSHDMDPSARWITESDLGVLNTAFLDDGRTLVLSADIDGVKAALDARQTQFFRAPGSWLVADALGEPLTAGIEIGIDACRGYAATLEPGGPDQDRALYEEVGPLGAWEAMGLGTYREDGRPSGRFAFAYGAPDDAAADVDGRTRLAREASSPYTGVTYAEDLLTVSDSAVDGQVITLYVTPADDEPRRLADAWLRRDLVFASCD